tara:strand:+ start:754 stop:1434 length:681 start_codon:yes stop_codon:yes gene_type:complete
MIKPQLFLLHFAGGNRYSFHFMTSFLNDFDVISLELPGRGSRIEEPLLRDFELASKDIFNQILEYSTNTKIMIFGHSMGALLALKVSKMLEEININPTCIVVSGNPGPGLECNNTTHLLDDEDFLVEVSKLEGIPDEVFKHADLIQYLTPILRADFELIEKNECKWPIIDTPIIAIMGNKEENVDEISNWKKYTKSSFTYKVFEGGHFFIYKNKGLIAKLLLNQMM